METGCLRIFAALLAIALAVFPATFSYAAMSPKAADCPHESAAPMTMAGHAGHRGPTQTPTGTPICCFLHGVAFAAMPAPAIVDIASSDRPFPHTERRFEGTDIEPALPPPRG